MTHAGPPPWIRQCLYLYYGFPIQCHGDCFISERAIARPSVCNVRAPYFLKPFEIFSIISTTIGTLAIR